MMLTIMCYSPAQQTFIEEIEKHVVLPRQVA
jgi:hypothetical protein